MLPGERSTRYGRRPGFYPEPRGAPLVEYSPQRNVLRAGQERGQPGGERYPEHRRPTPEAFAGTEQERHGRYESSAETTLGDTAAEVITFSGRPDRILCG